MNRREAMKQMGAAAAALTAAPSLVFTSSSEAKPSFSTETVNEETVRMFEAQIASCWRFSSSNLALTEQLLSPTLATLLTLTQRPSRYQKSLARLTSLGFMLFGIVALHHLNLNAREQYCQQAVQYARVSEDNIVQVHALRNLGGTYYHMKRPARMLQMYQEAWHIALHAPTQTQISLLAGMADAYALCGHRQEALYHLESIRQATFQPVEDDLVSLYSEESSLNTLYMRMGKAYLDLNQPREAFDMFTQGESVNAQVAALDRKRLEIINYKTKAIVMLGDMEQGLYYIEQGVRGAVALDSEKRFNEAVETYQQMRMMWPHESRVQQLASLFVR